MASILLITPDRAFVGYVLRVLSTAATWSRQCPAAATDSSPI